MGKSVSRVFAQATSTTPPAIAKIKEDINPQTYRRIKVHETSNQTPSPFSPWLFLQRYSIQICLQQTNKQVISEWEAINLLFQKNLMVDPVTVVYPWQSLDASNNPPIHLASTAFGFFALPTYVPWLVSHTWLDNQIQHPYIFLGSEVDPTKMWSNSVHGWEQPNKVYGLGNYLWSNRQNAWVGYCFLHLNMTYKNSDSNYIKWQGYTLP